MARTVRNPLELRTPVRTISSVMRNAPNKRFRPTELDFGGDYGRPERGGRKDNLTSVTRAPRETTTGGASVSEGATIPRGTTTAGTSKAPAAKPAITSAIKKPAVAAKTTTAAKPVVAKTTTTKAPVAAKTTTTKAPVAAKTTTTKPPVAAKTTTTKPTTTTKTTTKPATTTKSNSLTSVLKNAAIGAGTASLINKLTKKPTTTGGTTGETSVVKKPTGIPTNVVTKPTGVTTKPTGITTKPTGVTTRPTGMNGGTGVKPGGGTGIKPPTSVVKPPVTSKTGATGATGTLTEDQIQAELDRVKSEEEANVVPEGAVTNADGSYSVTEDGMVTTYDKDGNIIGMEAEQDSSSGDDTGGGATDLNTPSMDEDGQGTGMVDVGDGYMQDADGNIYTPDGTLLYTVGEDGDLVEASTDGTSESTEDETTWTDPDTGFTWNLGADGEWTQEGFDSSAEDETSWTDPDTGFTWNLGSDGEWTQEGFDDTSYDDTSYDDTSVDTSYDDTSYDDYVDDGTNYEEDAKGGSIVKKYKRNARRFEDGGLNSLGYGEDFGYSDTGEEVQPFQNVDYNYGEFDNPSMMGGDMSPYATSAVNNTYLRSASLPSPESFPDGFVNNGDGTATYVDDDGSTITIDADSNIVYVTDADGNAFDSEGNTVDPASVSSGSSMNGQPVNFSDNGDGTASYWDGQQYVTVDSETGNELYRTDENGQIVDAGDVTTNRPVGAVTSSGAGNRPSFATAAAEAAAGQGSQQDQSGVLDSLLNAVRDNPGLAGGAVGALIASLMDQAENSESAGPSQPVDISELTSFDPRTTDFGAGMVGGRTGTGSPIVSYSDYAEGYGDEEPDDRLYSDLGISGWLREPDMNNYRDEEGNLTDQSGNLVDEYGYLMDDGSAPEEEAAVEDAYEAEEEPAMAAGGTTHYTFGRVINPAENLGLGQGMKKGGLSQAHTVHSHHTNPVINNRVDFRKGSAVNGAGDGQSDDIPAWLADGEYVMDAELVSMLGNGSNKAGAKVLDKFRENIRAHKRSAPLGKIPPKAKSPLNYLKESMNG